MLTCKSSLSCEKCVQHLSHAAPGWIQVQQAAQDICVRQGSREVAPVVRQVTHAAGPLPGARGRRVWARYCREELSTVTRGSKLILGAWSWGQTYESLMNLCPLRYHVTPTRLRLATCYKFLCSAAPGLTSLLIAKCMLLGPSKHPAKANWGVWGKQINYMKGLELKAYLEEQAIWETVFPFETMRVDRY